jgi:predicted DNA-binding transcriptional regulator YafY
MHNRQNLRKPILSRIYFIDREIASGRYPNVHHLAKAYEVGTATIYRDIEFMKYTLGAPIEYNAKNRGWYYSEKTFRLPARFAAATDMLALGMTKSLISLYKDTPLYQSVERLLNDITAPLTPNDADAGQISWYEKRIIVPSVASSKINSETWDGIVNAMKDNRVITFDYKGIRDDEYRNRRVRPYQLLFDNGAWFLYGYSVERSAIRIFSLNRMKDVVLTGEQFSLPKDFDYCSKTGGSYFGVFVGEKKRYKIAFSPYAAPDVRDRQWTADQKITKQKNGDGITIEFTSTQYNKVLSWVLSFGAEARPLAPSVLVKAWKKHIAALYKSVKK